MKTLVHTDKELIEATIKKCDICYVGLADTDGTPYVLPMNFGYRDGVIYLHSAQEGRSISILERNPRVCITFSTDHDLVFQHPEVACSYRMRSKSVICWGEVHFEEDFDKHCRMRNFPFYLVQRSDIRGDANRWMPDPTFLYILPSGKITVAVVLTGTSTVNSNESASIRQSERTGPYRD